MAVAKISNDHRILAFVAEAKNPLSLSALDKMSGLQVEILESIMDYLCAQGMARQDEDECYGATRQTHIMVTPVFQGHYHPLVRLENFSSA